ncbi:MAG: isoleucine--tRNA ligase, partial [Rhodothermales bacterium]
KVERKGGWDTHGLPVEIEVEKQLGLEGRHQVEEYGIEKYNAACRESVLRYKELWDDLTVRMGYWVDLDNPYITFKNEYIESVWWLLKQIHEKGLLYKGYKIQWYSPGSGTVLSSHEVSLGYKEVQDPSVYVRFKVRDEADTYFLAWTTTPWTLISNTALAVGKSIDYVKVKQTDPDQPAEHLYLAKSLLGKVSETYEIVDEVKGTDLLGRTYEPLFDYFKQEEGADKAWRVVPADFVSTEDGTGIVHMAPAFGADDFEVGKKQGLPLFNPVTPDGVFDDTAVIVAGMWFKDADKVISRDLRDRGLLFRHETYLHNYPHDWRKGTPLMSYPVDSWFIRTTDIKDRLMQLNDEINWQPKSIGEGRFGEWLKNNVDWALSRRRYWGTPLPIWQSDAPESTYIEVIGSVAELREKCGDQIPAEDDLDLHRPFVDDFTWPAPDGGTMRRIPDLIDVWFDSGAMPFAQWHYPFENKDKFTENFPADFIAEGVDQTRGWFYTLHAISALVMNEKSYKNVVVNGLLLDDKGEKMSKSKGNAIDPFAIIKAEGADAVRWYMMSNTPPWENLKFAQRGLLDTKRKFFGTLQNVYSFFATYANIDGFVCKEDRIPVAERAELDRWVISRLNTTISLVDNAYASYHPTRAARAVEGFVEELSNWYIRRSRRRFWSAKKSNGDAAAGDLDKLMAYQTVYESLLTVSKLISPIAPFFSEWLYESLASIGDGKAEESVHLALFPEVETEAVDAELEHRMQLARTISSVVLSLRNKSNINVRQPLSRIMVVTGPSVDEKSVGEVKKIILDEVNVKDIEYISGASTIVNRSAKANFKLLGRRLGKQMKLVAGAVKALDAGRIDEFLSTGVLSLSIEGQEITLEGDEIEIVSEGIDGWLVEQEGTVTVALDTVLNDELVAEGLARETVNRIQNLRKSANFEVTDRIEITFDASELLAHAIGKQSAWIRNETLAFSLQEASYPSGEVVETFEIGKERLTLGIGRRK